MRNVSLWWARKSHASVHSKASNENCTVNLHEARQCMLIVLHSNFAFSIFSQSGKTHIASHHPLTLNLDNCIHMSSIHSSQKTSWSRTWEMAKLLIIIIVVVVANNENVFPFLDEFSPLFFGVCAESYELWKRLQKPSTEQTDGNCTWSFALSNFYM